MPTTTNPTIDDLAQDIMDKADADMDRLGGDVPGSLYWMISDYCLKAQVEATSAMTAALEAKDYMNRAVDEMYDGINATSSINIANTATRRAAADYQSAREYLRIATKAYNAATRSA